MKCLKKQVKHVILTSTCILEELFAFDQMSIDSQHINEGKWKIKFSSQDKTCIFDYF